MIYTIVKYGDPVLEKRAEPVTVFDDELKKLVDDMASSADAIATTNSTSPMNERRRKAFI